MQDHAIANIFDLDIHERTIAFLTYIIRMEDGIGLPWEEINFLKINEKFGKANAQWFTRFSIGYDFAIEYFLIYKDGECTALAKRITRLRDGGMEVDTGFTQFIMMPVSEGVRDLILALPKMMH